MALAPGEVLRVLADDPAARIDFPHFCAETGHVLVAAEDLDGCREYLICRRTRATASAARG